MTGRRRQYSLSMFPHPSDSPSPATKPARIVPAAAPYDLDCRENKGICSRSAPARSLSLSKRPAKVHKNPQGGAPLSKDTSPWQCGCDKTPA